MPDSGFFIEYKGYKKGMIWVFENMKSANGNGVNQVCFNNIMNEMNEWIGLY